MAFIRVKTRAGRRYAYLVESVWHPELASPRQRVLHYLGLADDVRPEDVPEEHRGDLAVTRWLATRGGHGRVSMPARDLDSLRADLRAVLLLPDRSLAERIARRAIAQLGASVFLEEVVRPLLVEIGEDWYAGRVSVADEHIVTRGIAEVVRQLREETVAAQGRPKRPQATVLLANPEGEHHSLALELLECRLLEKGHRVIVCPGGAPRRALAQRARELDPDLVILSSTMSATADEAMRAAEAVLAVAPHALVAVGGQAWQATSKDRDTDARLRIAGASSLEDADALVREALARRRAAHPTQAKGPER